ncbi:MAG: hypothetical protein L0213_02415, partial [Candidatus Dadabacteria bacterium]|nr:hypothetical protein [Candidatus Dadabacteria bacterium]
MRLKVALSMVIVGLFIGSSLTAMVAGTSRNGSEGVAPQVSFEEYVNTLLADPDIETFFDDGVPTESKMSESLSEKAATKMKVKVAIVTTDVTELALALNDYEYTGTPLGTKGTSGQLAVPVIEISASAVPNIAALPGVISVFEYEDPIKMSYDDSLLRQVDAAGAGE